MIPTWTIQPHIKGDTFNSRQITFPFDITDCLIKMQFRESPNSDVMFEWNTEDSTFEKISATEIVMKSKILDYGPRTYQSDLQVTFLDGTVYTYFKANLQIIQDFTK